MQMKRKHIYEDLLRSDVMSIHGYSSMEIRRMPEHQLLSLYNDIFATIDVGDTYTMESGEVQNLCLN